MKHISINIKGRVQGVWYRASTEYKAKTLGITGYVRNEKDGSVYVEAEGTSVSLKEFVKWCHSGPPLARVEEVEVTEGAMKGFKDFVQIR